MSKPYEFFEHTADIGFHAHGRTLQELFINAASAMYEAMGDLQECAAKVEKSVTLEGASFEDLLHDWLAELLYEVEVNHILYNQIEIMKLMPPVLMATLRGSSIDFARSKANEEIKAITYHQLCVEQLTDGTWRATVILDV